MTEQIQEPLNVEEPEAPEKPSIDVDSLVSELEKAGITNVGELSNKLRASQESGRLAQLLGDERKRSAESEAKLREYMTKPPAPKQDYMDYGEGQSIDIEAAIERSVSKVINKEKEAQRIAQEQNLQKWNFIRNDEDYGVVKEIWENKLKDPNFVYQIQAGAIDPVQDYHKTKNDYYKILLKKSHETITTMRGGGKVKPPHMESGGRTSANMVSETPPESDADKKIAAMRAKTDKGYMMTNEEELDLIDTIFGNKTPL